MKNYINIFLLVIYSCFIFSCKTNKTITKTIIRDSVIVVNKIDTTKIFVASDTLRFDSLINVLLLNEKQLNQSKSKIDSLKLISNKKQIIKELTKGVYKDTIYNINLETRFKSNDSTWFILNRIKVYFENGSIWHDITQEKAVVKTETQIIKTEINRKITFFNWIKDEKTLILLLIFGIFIVVIKIIK